jgi:hypothetical protein
MELVKITRRHRNDFHWIGRCRWCGHEERYGDGYADEFYCLKVVPHRHCSECGKNCYGETHDQRIEEEVAAAANGLASAEETS